MNNNTTTGHLRWIPFLALFKREVNRFFKVIFQTIATPLISTVLYLLIFGVSIGSQIETIPGVNYLQFLIPGLVMMSTIRNSFDNSSGSIITSKFVGELEDLRMAPLSPTQIIWGNGLASTLRGFIVGGVTLIIGCIFYWIIHDHIMTIHHPFILLFFLFVGGIAFANLGLGVCMICKNFEQVSAINTFILLPLIYLGGVFFSLDQLHYFWQLLSSFNPLLYFVNGVRYGILGFSDVSLIASSSISLLSWLGCYIFALWSLRVGSYHRW